MEAIPLFGQFGLANQIGTVEYSRPRRFRGILEQWLGSIRVIWPECPARISSDGQSIKIAPATSIVPGKQDMREKSSDFRNSASDRAFR